jgi:hypothetical protein
MDDVRDDHNAEAVSQEAASAAASEVDVPEQAQAVGVEDATASTPNDFAAGGLVGDPGDTVPVVVDNGFVLPSATVDALPPVTLTVKIDPFTLDADKVAAAIAEIGKVVEDPAPIVDQAPKVDPAAPRAFNPSEWVIKKSFAHQGKICGPGQPVPDDLEPDEVRRLSMFGTIRHKDEPNVSSVGMQPKDAKDYLRGTDQMVIRKLRQFPLETSAERQELLQLARKTRRSMLLIETLSLHAGVRV